MVGQAIAARLVALGHQVILGSRAGGEDKAMALTVTAGLAPKARGGNYVDAARAGEIVFNCTHGAASIAALTEAGAQHLTDKVIIDVANILPPDPSPIMSLGEQIQRAFPDAKVVKALNTVNCALMVDPGALASTHTLFMSGDDAGAKRTTRALLESFGWRDIIDLGDITTARATESYMPLWLTLWKALGTTRFNLQVVR